MGREIRRVPPNWKHPEGQHGKQPMYDQTFKVVVADWEEGRRKWDAGEDPDRENYRNGDGSHQTYAGWHGEAPDDPAYYRPWEDDEATWFQLWETVTEGTPVSPPFATAEELAQHLARHGDDWDEKRGQPGWGIERARAFVKAGYAPSMMISGGRLYQSSEIPLALQSEEIVDGEERK